jgi:hypothetical protein
MPLNATYPARSSDLQPISPNEVHQIDYSKIPPRLRTQRHAHAAYSEDYMRSCYTLA